jgi:hypothetical protein
MQKKITIKCGLMHNGVHVSCNDFGSSNECGGGGGRRFGMPK